MLDKTVQACMHWHAVAVTSVLMNQRGRLSEVSLSRNAHKTRLCTD